MTTLTEELAMRIARRLDVPVEVLFEDRPSAHVASPTTDHRVTGRRA
jgi:hypothetical protein